MKRFYGLISRDDTPTIVISYPTYNQATLFLYHQCYCNIKKFNYLDNALEIYRLY